MRVLLDTHIYLWWLQDSPRLPSRAAAVIAEPTTIVHVSTASIWEASIKVAAGRLALAELDLVAQIEENGFAEMPVSGAHAWAAGQLPTHHRDPFDRMLVAQARHEQLLLVSEDEVMSHYDVAVLRR